MSSSFAPDPATIAPVSESIPEPSGRGPGALAALLKTMTRTLTTTSTTTTATLIQIANQLGLRVCAWAMTSSPASADGSGGDAERRETRCAAVGRGQHPDALI